MPHNHPTLTIAIPTYNRPEQIQKQVRRILPQLSDDIVLNIYDNHSQKPVTELFSEEEKKYFNIIRNSVNIGADANIARCFEFCETEWLWTLSDDDLVTLDAVAIIRHLIEENKDTVFINVDPIRYTLKEHANDSPVNIAVQGYQEYLNQISYNYTNTFWLSCCVYNRTKIKDAFFYLFRYSTSMMAPAVMMLKYMETHKDAKVFITTEPMIFDATTDAPCQWNRLEYQKSYLCAFFLLGIKHKQEFGILRRNLMRQSLAEIFRAPDSTSRHDIYDMIRLVNITYGTWQILLKMPDRFLLIYLRLLLPFQLYQQILKFLLCLHQGRA